MITEKQKCQHLFIIIDITNILIGNSTNERLRCNLHGQENGVVHDAFFNTMDI